MATLALMLPEGPPTRALRLRGNAPGSESARIKLSVDDRPLPDLKLGPGPFEVLASAAGPLPPGPRLLRIERTPGFRLPPKMGQTARREVGLFLSAVCVVPGSP